MDIFHLNSNQDREGDIILDLVPPVCLEWQQDSGGNCCYHMFTLQGPAVSETLLIISKYTKYIAVRK
jgi:hypothetical protein